jgi:hypothetical protein
MASKIRNPQSEIRNPKSEIGNSRPPCEPARHREASAEADGQGEAGAILNSP